MGGRKRRGGSEETKEGDDGRDGSDDADHECEALARRLLSIFSLEKDQIQEDKLGTSTTAQTRFSSGR